MQDRAEKFFNRGVDFARFGEHEKAAVSFDKALEINQDYAEAKKPGNCTSKIRYVTQQVSSSLVEKTHFNGFGGSKKTIPKNFYRVFLNKRIYFVLIPYCFNLLEELVLPFRFR